MDFLHRLIKASCATRITLVYVEIMAVLNPVIKKRKYSFADLLQYLRTQKSGIKEIGGEKIPLGE